MQNRPGASTPLTGGGKCLREKVGESGKVKNRELGEYFFTGMAQNATILLTTASLNSISARPGSESLVLPQNS